MLENVGLFSTFIAFYTINIFDVQSKIWIWKQTSSNHLSGRLGYWMCNSISEAVTRLYITIISDSVHYAFNSDCLTKLWHFTQTLQI